MIVIALDTTTRIGSVALVEDGRVVEERAGDGARTHAQRLPGEIMSVVDAHGRTLADVDLYAVASGPGSFTGLRIGLAAIQGLAFVHGQKTIGIAALDAMAEIAAVDMTPDSVVAAWMDAHRGEVFAAVYRVTGAPPFSARRLIQIEEPTAADPVSTLARWGERLTTQPAGFIGDGAVLYEAAIRQQLPAAGVHAAPPLAAAIGRLATARRADAVPPADLRALYVRRPDAELERERRSLEQR